MLTMIESAAQNERALEAEGRIADSKGLWGTVFYNLIRWESRLLSGCDYQLSTEPEDLYKSLLRDCVDDGTIESHREAIIRAGNAFEDSIANRHFAQNWVRRLTARFQFDMPNDIKLLAIRTHIDNLIKLEDQESVHEARLADTPSTWGEMFYELVLWETELIQHYEPPFDISKIGKLGASELKHQQEARTVDHSFANFDGVTPLQLAANRGKADMVNALLELYSTTLWTYGAVTKKSVPLSELDTFIEERTMNHKVSALELAVKNLDPETLQNPVMKTILQAKWILYGRRVFLWSLYAQVLYMICFTAMLFLLPNDRNFHDPSWSGVNVTDYTFNPHNSNRLQHLKLLTGANRSDPDYNLLTNCERLVVEGVLFFWNLYKIRKEFLQARANLRTYFTGFGRFENWVQLILMVLFFVGVWLRGVNNNFGETFVWSIYAIIGWISLLYFSKGSFRFGPLSIVLWEVLTDDVVNFGFILLAFLFGFSQAFWLIMGPFGDKSGQNPNDGDDPGFKEWANWMPGSFVWSLRGFFGQGATFDTFRSSNTQTSYTLLLFLVFTFFCNILFVNVFIALINQTFSRVVGNAQKRWMVQWAGLIMEIDERILAKHKLATQWRRRNGMDQIPPRTAVGIPREIRPTRKVHLWKKALAPTSQKTRRWWFWRYKEYRQENSAERKIKEAESDKGPAFEFV
ncbi:hypothetical protein DFJ73DRAFT_859284, partial [Zopfochytrium polystomum]